MENKLWYKRGLRDGIPIALGYFAVAFTLGIVAKNAGLTALQTFFATALTNASAGGYAGFTLIGEKASYIDMALTILVVNIRYLLMSAALSQKLSPKTPLRHRLLIGFDVTDEIFGVSMQSKGNITFAYFMDISLLNTTWIMVFEIVSYSILKFYYKDIHKHIIWGYVGEELQEDYLHLYKTGRTNANDGGIDFVMKPLGRFFQVTETLDFKKYFLDIEKIERYPLSFVIKSDDSIEDLLNKIKTDAQKTYIVEDVVDAYLDCIEEVINIPLLKSYIEELSIKGLTREVLNEIIRQSKVEFNYEEE